MWIEISMSDTDLRDPLVTPFAGVWIEIRPTSADSVIDRSLPSRECGLKSFQMPEKKFATGVTPFAGVWIEILQSFAMR